MKTIKLTDKQIKQWALEDIKSNDITDLRCLARRYEEIKVLNEELEYSLSKALAEKAVLQIRLFNYKKPTFWKRFNQQISFCFNKMLFSNLQTS